MHDVPRYVRTAGGRHMMRMTGGNWVLSEDHDRFVRSLRAKLMRERAETHEANSKVAFLASHDMRRERCSAQAEVYEAESESLIQRARRLRAEADRVEKGKP